MGQQPTNNLSRTGNVGHVWDVWMIPLSKDRVCHKQNLKDLVPLLAPWFSVPSVSYRSDEDHSAIVTCMNHDFRTWWRRGVNIIHPDSWIDARLSQGSLLIQQRFFSIATARVQRRGPAKVAGPGDDFIQKHAKTTEIHGFPKTMIYYDLLHLLS